MDFERNGKTMGDIFNKTIINESKKIMKKYEKLFNLLEELERIENVQEVLENGFVQMDFLERYFSNKLGEETGENS